MGYILYFGVIAINLFCVCTKKKSKMIALFSVLALALVMGFAGTQFGDLQSYAEFYKKSATVENTRLEPGYVWLNSVFLNMGFSFNDFRVITFLICAFLIYLAMKEWTKEYNLMVLLYALSIFYFLSVALRFFFGFAIVMYASRFLWKKKWINIVWYVLLVLLATQFHTSFYVMLLFLLCYLPPRALKATNHVLWYLSGLSMFLVLLMLVNTDFISFMSGVVNRTALELFSEMEELTDAYFSGNYSRRYVMYIAFYVLNVFCTQLSFRFLSQNRALPEGVQNKTVCIQLISLTLSMTILMSQTMIRLLFVVILLGFFAAGRTLQTQRQTRQPIKAGTKTLSVGAYIALIVGSALTWFVMIYVVGDLGFNLMRFLGNNTLFS